MTLLRHVAPLALSAEIASGRAPRILDVRSSLEYVRGHVPGSVHIPFWSLGWRARSIPGRRDDPIVVYCGHGPRAWLAGAALRWYGFRQVQYLAGHFSAWQAEGLPEERLQHQP